MVLDMHLGRVLLQRFLILWCCEARLPVIPSVDTAIDWICHCHSLLYALLCMLYLVGHQFWHHYLATLAAGAVAV